MELTTLFRIQDCIINDTDCITDDADCINDSEESISENFDLAETKVVGATLLYACSAEIHICEPKFTDAHCPKCEWYALSGSLHWKAPGSRYDMALNHRFLWVNAQRNRLFPGQAAWLFSKTIQLSSSSGGNPLHARNQDSDQCFKHADVIKRRFYFVWYNRKIWNVVWWLAVCSESSSPGLFFWYHAGRRHPAGKANIVFRTCSEHCRPVHTQRNIIVFRSGQQSGVCIALAWYNNCGCWNHVAYVDEWSGAIFIINGTRQAHTKQDLANDMNKSHIM